MGPVGKEGFRPKVTAPELPAPSADRRPEPLRKHSHRRCEFSDAGSPQPARTARKPRSRARGRHTLPDPTALRARRTLPDPTALRAPRPAHR